MTTLTKFIISADIAMLLVPRITSAQETSVREDHPTSESAAVVPQTAEGADSNTAHPPPLGKSPSGSVEVPPAHLQRASVGPLKSSQPRVLEPAKTPTADHVARTQNIPLPNKLSIGNVGWVQVGAVLQAWYDTTWQTSDGDRQTKSTALIRRAQIRLVGDIIPDVAAFNVAFDPAIALKFSTNSYATSNGALGSADSPTVAQQTITTYVPPRNTSILQDYGITLKSRFADVTIGQYIVPISFEGQSPSSELVFPERAYSSRYYGDFHDMGVRLGKKFETFRYQIFVLNGQGPNQVDANLQKDLAVRLEFMPLEGFMFGLAGLASVGQRAQVPTTKERIEFDCRVDRSGVLVQGEFIWGTSGQAGTYGSGVPRERTKSQGRHVMIGYTFGGILQPVIRLGYLDTDATVVLGQPTSYGLYNPFGIVTDEVRSYEVGLNYFLRGHALKVQAAYGYFDFDGVPALSQLTLATQAFF